MYAALMYSILVKQAGSNNNHTSAHYAQTAGTSQHVQMEPQLQSCNKPNSATERQTVIKKEQPLCTTVSAE